MIAWALFGGVVGWIATLLVGAGDALGMTGSILVGIIGAFVGGWIADSVQRRSLMKRSTVERIAPAPQNARTETWDALWAVAGAAALLLVVTPLV